ncbi:uncharacterized protein [Anabrus simplex]|uniref:uncharacterized protein isoform X2 n=1 Tax=Anabrus simplex TaxID=316456 RepID=UPI0035A27A06
MTTAVATRVTMRHSHTSPIRATTDQKCAKFWLETVPTMLDCAPVAATACYERNLVNATVPCVIPQYSATAQRNYFMTRAAVTTGKIRRNFLTNVTMQTAAFFMPSLVTTTEPSQDAVVINCSSSDKNS